jgi:NADPH:quinone reductase
MRAIRVSETGGPSVMTVEDVPTPEPGTNEVRVKVAAAGVNFLDVYFRSGQYPAELPLTPGVEAAGTVEAVGAGVTDAAIGDRVAFMGVRGAYAEQVIVPSERLVPVPQGITLEQAAAVMLQGVTAHYLATSTFPLEAGHSALVHAGAGGVGLLLTQIAKMRGATVYTTVSTEEKAERSRSAGADHVILYTEVDFAGELRRLGPEGVHVVYDSVGRDTFDQSLTCLRERGMAVLFGQSSGAVDPVAPQRLNTGGGLFLTRPSTAHYAARRDELLARAADVFAWVADGRLQVRIDETHELGDAPRAHERLEGRRTTGKLLLRP